MAASFVCNKTCMVLMGLTLFLALIDLQQVEGGRPLLRIEQPWLMKDHLIIQSLPRGSPTTPTGNPCTHIPKSSKGRCTMQVEVDGAGHNAPSEPVTAPKDNGIHLH
ncbi:OLC1v1026469C1 [Oldenlandia corymbosa var. corymbosa]|uniref:OLC1v1026469C1 n=1 Tax=Oldenlandia corymbosa var. corymbosa TaxID=529605 RepID=A0AAV1C759_OLDCO|nr:OLC1v1026469C1 [Oldenlandia corymbosa var. corymbosa]